MVITIWEVIDCEICLIFYAPEIYKKFADFIKCIEKAKYLIISFGKDSYSYIVKLERKLYI